MWSCAKSQAARRKLWHGKSFDGERNKDETALSEKKSHDILPAQRERSSAVLSAAHSQTCLPGSPAVISGPSRMSPLSPRTASGQCSPARNWAVHGKGSAGTWAPAKSLDIPRRDNFRELGDSRGFPAQKEKSPCCLHGPPRCPAGSSSCSVPCGSSTPVPMVLLLPTSHLSAASKARDPRLEELWVKAPQNKLEQLKKRIQEQKRKQQAAPREEERLIFAKDPLPKRALKRKVCRVASAPPAPAHRDQRERSSAWRIQTEHQRQLSSKSCVLERAVAGKGVNLPGVSAWREGQKLSRRLLGPPPPLPHLRSRTGEQSTAKIFEPLEGGRGLGAMPVVENSSRVKGNEPVGRSPGAQSSVVAPSKAGRGSTAPTEGTNQALRNLLLQRQSCEEDRHIRLPRDPPVKHQGIHSPSPGISSRKDGAKPSTSGSCSRGRSASPQRQKESEKENLMQPSKRRANLKKPHPYSPESVQEFMYRKKAERKRKLLKEKKSLAQAAEMKKRRLQELYRRQKEAIGKKSCPNEMYKPVGKTGSAKGNPQCELEQEQTSGGVLERSFMAWVDETSSPLSPEDHRGSCSPDDADTLLCPQQSTAIPCFGGSSTFHGSSLAVVEQCLRAEELRARHQAVLLQLRRKALRERARAELAWLGHHRRVLENLKDSTGASAMAAKQYKILMELKREQAEIQHLKNIHRAAHQERKLLLKQQREILMMHHSTAQLQENLHSLAGKQEVVKSGSQDNCVQLKHKKSKKYEGFSTENKESLVQHQKQVKELPGLEQCLNAQDDVFLPLEPTNSAGMEPIATLLTRKGRKCVFLESVLEEKALLSNPDPEDNEDINPCGRKSPVKGLGMLPTWCNLCLVQEENTLEGTVKEVEVPVPSEIHQVDASQCLKHLDHISHEASDEGNLKAFSDGSTSMESLSKSNNYFLQYESAKSDSSHSEFQKVSAVWISFSKNSISDPELELKHGEDTDISVPEEFVCDSADVFANISKEMPIAIRNGKETSPSDKHNEHELPEDDRAETSSLSQKYPGDMLGHGCTDHLLSFIPADEAIVSRTKSAHFSQSENPSERVDEPHLSASQSCSRNKPCSQEILTLGNDAAASPSCTDATSSSDKGLPPTDKGTLSEMLCPVGEVLSSGSADLPSSNKKDLSFPSEDLPPPPLGEDAMKNGDPASSMDDFTSPLEQMTGSESSQGMDEDLLLEMDALPPLPDNTVPEEFPLLSTETSGAFSAQDGCLSEQSITALSSCLSENQHGEQEMPLQHLEFLPVSNTDSSGRSKSPEFPMKQCKMCEKLPSAEDSDDPLSSFETGDRVLVKQSQPGTLMFKGQTHFGSGHWAGVALDKAEGHNAGTYEGVKYFECAQYCGVFVRPDEISHLFGVNKNCSSYMGNEDSDSFHDDDSLKGDCNYSEDGVQRVGLAEEKAEDTSSAGGSEVKENQSGLHRALLCGKGQKLPHSIQCNCTEFLCQMNLMCLGSDKEKPELAQIKQTIFADALPKKSKTDEVNTSKNICCLVEDQKRIKLADDIASELSEKLLFDILIAFSETAQHKYKSAFEKDMMNYGKGLRQEDNQKPFPLKENSVAALSESSAKVSDVLLGDFDTLCIHGCHTVTDRIVTKFIDDAVKEYKKIKRKHRSKADKILHLSPETSPTTLPLLSKILDAGVFGSSEDFDQPNCDQNMLVRQTQKQHLYKLDQWHSAPWKKTVEVPLVIPHNSSYVKNLSAYAVEELWTPENMKSNFRNINVPKYLESSDLPGNDLEAESKRMYNQVIFDLSHELLCAEYQVTAKPNMLPRMEKTVGSPCSRHLCRRTDVSDVKMFVQGEIIKIMNLEKNDLEMKRKFLNMTKYGNSKRDRVDLILIQELRKEESQWTSYGDDELTVKMRMTEAIFDSLILDTIRVLNKIYLKKACLKGDCAPSFFF
ncbi:coiled-coil domain-containing protein 187 [Serinus canaria]|uniref:coiled-coil domain-containing protein 187 n=1 Tax=Serinus canaria TaxID=9135 RepID=UPI0021CD0BC0|nr:coiled-coil domain-containing protein 187 [Serinus canaria]